MSALRTRFVVAATVITFSCVASIASLTDDENDDLEKTKMELKKVTEELQSTKKKLSDLVEMTRHALAIKNQEIEAFSSDFQLERKRLLANQQKMQSVLTESLKSPQAAVRAWGAQALGKLGPLAKDHVTELAELQKDSDKTVAKAAAEALRQIGTKKAEKSDR